MLSICLEAPETLLAITAVAFKFRVDFFDTTASAPLEIVHASLQGSSQPFNDEGIPGALGEFRCPLRPRLSGLRASKSLPIWYGNGENELLAKKKPVR